MMYRFPGIMRDINESLDEIIRTMDKVNSICQSAEQISPMIKQFSELLAEANASASEKARVSGAGTKKGRSPASGGTKIKQRSYRKAKREWYL